MRTSIRASRRFLLSLQTDHFSSSPSGKLWRWSFFRVGEQKIKDGQRDRARGFLVEWERGAFLFCFEANLAMCMHFLLGLGGRLNYLSDAWTREKRER